VGEREASTSKKGRRRGRRGRRRPPDPFHGFLLVDKPPGPTSHDVVDRIRRCFRLGRVGHGGTLDPFATGLLVVLIGRKATRLSRTITDADKAYEGTARLGVRTDTMDVEGQVLAERPVEGVTREQVEAAMAAWVGEGEQVPPMYSAVKREGVPMYERARRGESVEREPRPVRIDAFDLVSFDPPDVTFRLVCSKGTYVRTLWDDVGEALGCGAYLHALRRTRIGTLQLDDAWPLDAILELDVERLAGLCRALPV
jgi:tRNA pseudouridine55 synthase